MEDRSAAGERDAQFSTLSEGESNYGEFHPGDKQTESGLLSGGYAGIGERPRPIFRAGRAFEDSGAGTAARAAAGVFSAAMVTDVREPLDPLGCGDSGDRSWKRCGGSVE